MTPGCGSLRMESARLSANGWEPGGNVPLIVEIKDEGCICDSRGWKGKPGDEKKKRHTLSSIKLGNHQNAICA